MAKEHLSRALLSLLSGTLGARERELAFVVDSRSDPPIRPANFRVISVLESRVADSLALEFHLSLVT